MKAPGPGLALRPRLALAVLLIFAAPALTLAVVGISQYHDMWSSGAGAAEVVHSEASLWNDPPWRSRASADLAASGYSFTLIRDQKVIYASRRSLFTGRYPPFAGGQQMQVQQVTAPNAPPGEIAYVYGSALPWRGNGTFWLVPLAGLAALLITLALLSWYFGRTLVGPLTASGQAARQIAAGDLEVRIPDSRIREVAELKSAFSVMSSELQASMLHQAQLEEERRMFIGAIAHDLRTPLFSLRGYLEGLEEGLASTPAKRRAYIRICREKADALEGLIGDLFAYARVEYLEQTLRREQVDVGDLVGTLVGGRVREAEAAGTAFEAEMPPKQILVLGDRRLLDRAIENIVDNALRYTPPGGLISIRANAIGGRVSLTVADSGPGIPPSDLERIFEPMYRGVSTEVLQDSGSGLGLAISRRIFRAHGGDLVAANARDGGAILTGTLPRSNTPLPSVEADDKTRRVRVS